MISIAIVDDEQMYLDKEKRITEEYFCRKGQECRIELFQDAEWLLCELRGKEIRYLCTGCRNAGQEWP